MAESLNSFEVSPVCEATHVHKSADGKPDGEKDDLCGDIEETFFAKLDGGFQVMVHHSEKVYSCVYLG